MRARSTLSAVALGCCLATTALTGPAEADGGFAGSWTAIDHDGSSMTLVVRGGGGERYAVRMVDDSATSVCHGSPASVSGAGVADGAALWVRMTLACMPGGNVIRHRIEIGFFYNVTTDTLTDTDDVEWSRAG